MVWQALTVKEPIWRACCGRQRAAEVLGGALLDVLPPEVFAADRLYRSSGVWRYKVIASTRTTLRYNLAVQQAVTVLTDAPCLSDVLLTSPQSSVYPSHGGRPLWAEEVVEGTCHKQVATRRCFVAGLLPRDPLACVTRSGAGKQAAPAVHVHPADPRFNQQEHPACSQQPGRSSSALHREGQR
jgi:hypothetical protein